jgi:hypothetical protein
VWRIGGMGKWKKEEGRRRRIIRNKRNERQRKKRDTIIKIQMKGKKRQEDKQKYM